MAFNPANKNTMKQEELLKFYNANGYYVAKSVFDKSQVKSVLDSINLLFAQQLPNSQPSIFQNMKGLFDADLTKYLKVAGALSRSYEAHELLLSKKVTELLSALNMTKLLVPTGPVVHIMSQDLMVPNGYYGLPPHQDYPSMQGSLDSLIVWVPLVDIDRDLYPLEIIPKSNWEGMLLGKMNEKYYEIDPALYKNEDFIPVEVEAGDVVLMSSFTVHRSGTSGRKNDVRLACSIRFDNAEEENFVNRTYPTVYKRSVDRVILEEGFPTKEQVRKIFSN